MAITIKPKQAFGFLDPRNCICNSPYCQPILTTDSFMIQGTATAETDLIQNGDFTSSSFWTLASGFTISGGKLHGVNVPVGNGAVSDNPLGLEVGKVYLIQVSVTVISQGSAGAGEGWKIYVNGGYLQLPDSIPLGDGYNQSLTASWVYSPSSIFSDKVLFETDESTIDFDVEYIRVFEVSNPGMALYSAGTLVDDIPSFPGSNLLKYYFAGTQFMSNGALTGANSLLLEAVNDVSVLWELFIDTWASVTSETGCLTAGFYDTLWLTNRIRNGDFDIDLSYWEAGAHWIAGPTGRACYSGDGITAGSLDQTITLEGGRVYNFSFLLSGMTLTSTIQVQYTDPSGSTTVVYTGNSISPRTHVFDLTNYPGTQTVTVSFQEGGGNPEMTFCVDNVILVADDQDPTYITNCINIQSEHPCTLLLFATNLDNAFGLDYSFGLRHFLRVYGKIKYSDYPEESEPFKFSDNTHLLLYASSEKEFEVLIGDAPEQIHDCIAILRLHDFFEIDNVSYITNSKYDINRRKTSDNSQSVFTVLEQTGVAPNYNCT